MTGIVAALMITVFWIPTDTFESTGTVIEGYGKEPELIQIHTGDKVAVYVHEPTKSNGHDPIIFITGGPGGTTTKSTNEYLEEYAKLGYTVYTYDPIGCGQSPLPKSSSSYSMNHEVEVVKDIMEYYGIKKANLIASSYGGNVAVRYIEKYPNLVNTYLAVDTAPLYSMDLNYPEQAKEIDFLNSVDDTRMNPLTPPMPSIMNYASFRQLVRMLYGMNLMKILGKDNIPYGNPEEYDYMISVMVSLATNSFTKDGKPTRHMNYLSNTLNTISLENSEDFTVRLKNKKTPPVLVVQPEYGVVPWQIHYQYKEFFNDIQFVIAPDSGHAVWASDTGRDIIVRNGDALFRGIALPDAYTSSANPFPPLEK